MRSTHRALATLLVLPVLAGCTAVVPVGADVQRGIAAAIRGADPEPIVIADPGTGSGSIVSADTMPTLPIQVRLSGVNAAKVVYRSVQPGVGEREVSGTVFTPSGDAPEGGWPIISYAHGTTGIEQECAPSESSSLLESLSRRDPALNLDDYRSGNAAQDWAALTGCTPDKAGARDDAVKRLGNTDFAPKSDEAAAALREALTAMAVPTGPASAPMLVAYGDADTFIDAAWTDAAVEHACAFGDVITIDRQAGRGHGDVNGDAVNAWIADRFAGVPAQNDCSR